MALFKSNLIFSKQLYCTLIDLAFIYTSHANDIYLSLILITLGDKKGLQTVLVNLRIQCAYNQSPAKPSKFKHSTTNLVKFRISEDDEILIAGAEACKNRCRVPNGSTFEGKK